MLRGLHKASSTWLGKALMAGVMGLIISFAIWGIGDIFRGFGLNSATRSAIRRSRPSISGNTTPTGCSRSAGKLGRPITPEQARALGIDRQILGQLVAETTLDEQAMRCGSEFRNAEIVSRITSDPNFLGLNGQFDRSRFEQVIRQAGFTESRFVAEQRRVTLRRQIAQTLGGEMRVPVTSMTAINQFQNETPDIEFVRWARRRPAIFRHPPPNRSPIISTSARFCSAPPNTASSRCCRSHRPSWPSRIDVSDADANAYYEQHQDNYGTPEKRELRQIVFPKPRRRGGARERIAKGASFADIAKERGLKDSDTDLGIVTKALIDPAVADAAFALKPGEISATGKRPLRHRAGQAGKIEPGQQTSYEEVAPQIKRDRGEQSRSRDRRSARQARGRARRRLTLTSPPRNSASMPASSTRSTAPAAARTARRSPTCRSPT